MPDIEISAPYNNQPESLDEIFKLKRLNGNKIREVFLSGPQEYSGAGRAGSINAIQKMTLEQFIELADRIHSQGLRVNLVMNSTCEGSGWYSPGELNKLLEYLRVVHKEHDVEAVTLANPVIIKEVRRHFPELEISASVLGDIDSLQRAAIYADLGANVITPDVNINRDLELLKEIKKSTGVELKLMVNEGCLYKCPFRKFHFNYISHKSRDVELESYVFSEACFPITAGDFSQVLKSCWIRPEDMKKYNGITDYFKIVGRSIPTSKVTRIIRAYMNEDWDGDIFDILCSNLGFFGWQTGACLNNKSLGSYNFFEKVTSCGRKCNQCNYCEKLVKKLISLGEYTQEKLEDLGYKDMIGKSLDEAGLTDLVEVNDNNGEDTHQKIHN